MRSSRVWMPDGVAGRVLLWCCAVAMSLILAPVSAAASVEPGLTRHVYSNAAGTREYLLFLPDRSGPVPLVVFLHGCGADPEAYGLDRFAEQEGFAVAYPVQSTAANSGGCWNWYRDSDRHRDAGEPSIIAGITNQVRHQARIDPRRVVIAGHSAGAGMAAVLADAYPDVYAAAGLLAGCGQLTCADISGLTAYREMGSHARPIPAYIAWATNDTVEPYPLGRIQLLQWLATNDLADNGRADLSQPRLPASIQLLPAAGPQPAFTIEHYRDRRGCAPVDFASGIGMGHVPDFTWQPIFPTMTAFLLHHPKHPC